MAFGSDYLTEYFNSRLEAKGGREALEASTCAGELFNPQNHQRLVEAQKDQQRRRAEKVARQRRIQDQHLPGMTQADHDHARCIRAFRAAHQARP